ncbi:molybdate ABC transporter substrate-binding protein [Paraburkholderia diazotrophica]|uniref:Molybdate transport system substrate-binding protein n=1 Tax=Paraburkholderia diazotrophica TaxID=667676 RepID=A0A1H7DBU1_9BURK|nr:molybdate ABC transporter substrate-binding protein [Paraburkholderia diazotrophica]SEJ99273.1 molybdate transport system substrate-binding protein [Paraburkholderia diazotrophica]
MSVTSIHRFLKPAVLAASALSFAFGAQARADEIVVSAAASLTNAFKAVGDAYEQQHPGTKLLFNFGASDVLMQQIAKGAPADVFASADQKAMDKAVEQKVIVPSTRTDFAANSLVLIVPADGKRAPSTLNELTTASVKRVAYGDPASVPVGRYTEGALKAAGVWDAVSAKGVLAANVRQSLDYVSRGEVDAGFVFGTDAAVMPGKIKVALTVPTTTPITYPIAQVEGSKHAADAQSFIGFVLSPAGQAVLAKYGFKPAH